MNNFIFLKKNSDSVKYIIKIHTGFMKKVLDILILSKILELLNKK